MPEVPRPAEGTLVVTGDPEADQLLNTNPLALMIGMLLDQQVPIEWAFAGPFRLAQRLDGTLDAVRIAAMDPEELAAVAAQKPAVHRFPTMMGRRIHKLCEHLVDEYEGDPASLWSDTDDAEVLYKRLLALPGYGPVKAQIFMSILAKRFDCQPSGWEAIAGVFASEDLRSVADLGDPGALGRLREKRRSEKRRAEKSQGSDAG